MVEVLANKKIAVMLSTQQLLEDEPVAQPLSMSELWAVPLSCLREQQVVLRKRTKVRPDKVLRFFDCSGKHVHD